MRARGGDGTCMCAAGNGAIGRGALLVLDGAIQWWRAAVSSDIEAHRRRSAGSVHLRRAHGSAPPPYAATPVAGAIPCPHAVARRAARCRCRARSNHRWRRGSARCLCGANRAMDRPSATYFRWRHASALPAALLPPPRSRTQPRWERRASTSARTRARLGGSRERRARWARLRAGLLPRQHASYRASRSHVSTS